MYISEYYSNGYDSLIGEPLITCNCEEQHTEIDVVAYYVCDNPEYEVWEEWPPFVIGIYSSATH